MEIFGQTDIGLLRSANQDAFGARMYGETVVAVVCDGMGGANAGEVASHVAVGGFLESMDAYFTSEAPPDRREEALLRAVAEAAERAGALVCERAETDIECRGMGTTLVAAAAAGERAVAVNVGDSRAYHISGVNAVQVTRDHSVVQDMVARGELTPREARRHPRRNLITRALGDATGSYPDIFPVSLKRGDYLLLCSDGLTNLLTGDEIAETTRGGGDLSELCRRLIDEALRRGAPDNVTVVIIKA